MFAILKGATRIVVLGGLVTTAVVGTSLAVAGRERTAAIAHHAKDRVISAIDRQIDDPTALRAQLRELEKEYPKRVAALAGDLGELREQMRQLERERAIAQRVVQLADADLGPMEEAVRTAMANRANGMTPVANGGVNGREPGLVQAQTRLEQVRQTRFVYAGRAADAGRDLEYLGAQSQRIEDALAQVETERAQFQAQLWQIERQVDSIARNERLIDMMSDRKKTLEQAGRFEAVSLDHVVGRLSEVRTRQEAELQVLANDQKRLGYEDQARYELDVPGKTTATSSAGTAEAAAAAYETLVLPQHGLRPMR